MFKNIVRHRTEMRGYPLLLLYHAYKTLARTISIADLQEVPSQIVANLRKEKEIDVD